MTEEPAQAAEAADKKPAGPIIENRTYHDVLKALLGRVVTIANPESYEEGGLGSKLETEFYKGKLAGLGEDYLILATELAHGSGKNAQKEPVKQYIPISRIKRISLMKSQRILHL